MSITKIERLRKEMDTAISTEDFQLAFQVVNDMLDIDPENAQFWNSKGVILAKLNRIEEALESFDRGLLLDQNEPRIWYSKGCVLMESEEFRLALACFYKSLDLDPAYTKAKDRFIRCLDEWVESGGERGNEPSSIGQDHQDTYEEDLDESDMEWSEEKRVLIDDDEEEEGIRSVPRSQEIMKQREIKGTFLDDDLFSDENKEETKDASWEESEEDSGEEEWSEEEMEGWDEEDGSLENEKDILEDDDASQDDEDDEDDDAGEEWVEEELEGWDGEDEPSDDGSDIGPNEEIRDIKKTITCKCGDDIPIFSDERPYRFECPSCGRTGTLKK
ncbi:MAG: tetratricopeptide repeat protein [Candidatus Thermoplasmatota archaeon]|nr:tetratricopeptide repeat protein [Candidatus Thermoplasmatota archaeon]